MRMETLPLVIGGLIGLLGLALVLDAWLPDDMVVSRERRRRPRHPRDRAGEAMVGLGIIAMAAAWLGRDSWRWSVLVVIVGAALLLWGTRRSAGYLRSALQGSVRRGAPSARTRFGPGDPGG
jgi:L-lactate permease